VVKLLHITSEVGTSGGSTTLCAYHSGIGTEGQRLFNGQLYLPRLRWIGCPQTPKFHSRLIPDQPFLPTSSGSGLTGSLPDPKDVFLEQAERYVKALEKSTSRVLSWREVF